MKLPPNQACPCDSGKKFKKCCRRILEGSPATTPEMLMRSRYTAYATGEIDHILATTHPQSPHHQADQERWRQETRQFCEQTVFTRLEVQSSREDGDQGWVLFTAHLEQAGQKIPMQEHSSFLRVDGRWLYVRAEPAD